MKSGDEPACDEHGHLNADVFGDKMLTPESGDAEGVKAGTIKGGGS